MQEEKPCRKELRQLLEVEGAGGEKKVEEVEEKANRRRKSIEAYDAISERNLDEDWNKEDKYA